VSSTYLVHGLEQLMMYCCSCYSVTDVEAAASQC
jgi:hypothetical protein